MDKFQEGFINEAYDLLASLESALLSLEDNKEDKEKVGEIFRVMHSLKGTASMFGFDKIGELTHHLENIYDLIRADKLVLTATMLSASLSALDLIHHLLEDPNLEQEENKTQFDTLQSEIIAIVNSIDGNSEMQTTGEQRAVEKTRSLNTYHVKINMVKEIFLTITSGYCILL